MKIRPADIIMLLNMSLLCIGQQRSSVPFYYCLKGPVALLSCGFVRFPFDDISFSKYFMSILNSIELCQVLNFYITQQSHNIPALLQSTVGKAIAESPNLVPKEKLK